MSFEFNSIEEIAADLAAGKPVVMLDNEDRENEAMSSVRQNLLQQRMSTSWQSGREVSYACLWMPRMRIS